MKGERGKTKERREKLGSWKCASLIHWLLQNQEIYDNEYFQPTLGNFFVCFLLSFWIAGLFMSNRSAPGTHSASSVIYSAKQVTRNGDSLGVLEAVPLVLSSSDFFFFIFYKGFDLFCGIILVFVPITIYWHIESSCWVHTALTTSKWGGKIFPTLFMLYLLFLVIACCCTWLDMTSWRDVPSFDYNIYGQDQLLKL